MHREGEREGRIEVDLFEEVRVRLKKDLETEKADTLKKAMEARLRKNAKIEEL